MPLTFEGTRAIGATLGSGVVVAFDDTVDLWDTVLRIAAFFRDESCGQCVPCRVGTVRQEEALHRLARQQPLGSVEQEKLLLEEIGQVMRDASICGLGQTAAGAAASAVHKLGLLTGGRSRALAARGSQALARRPRPARSSSPSTAGAVRVPEGTTLLEACRADGIDTPTLCYLENLTPVNVCRVCVVEVEGSRTLVPACSRAVEPGMEVKTDSERVRLSRRMVLELLASSVDLGTAPAAQEYLATLRGAARALRPARRAARPGERDARGARAPPRGRARAAANRRPAGEGGQRPLRPRLRASASSATSASRPAATDAQNTFAIAVAGRGFDARISTEHAAPLPDSACVYCGNCIGVCPTGALMFKSEHEMRRREPGTRTGRPQTDTICAYCGVGCTLTLHVQDNRIVKVTSPLDHDVTRGHLCIKGRFGFESVQSREPEGT